MKTNVETRVTSIEKLDDFDDEYVYDVGMSNGNHNWFFGNDILVKNTDSVTDDAEVEVNGSNVTIGKLFHDSITTDGDIFHLNDSEYVFPKNVTTVTYDNVSGINREMEIDYVYRHKVEKEMFEVEDEDGNVVVITGDHSIMVERDGTLMEVKPTELLDDDLLIGM